MPDLGMSERAQPLPSAELNLGGTSTSEGQFLTASAFGSTAAGQPLVCPFPGSGVVKNRPFTIRVGGRISTAVASNFTAKLYFGSSSTIASNTNIATTGAIGSIAGASVPGTWALEFSGAIDGTGNVISGLQKGWVNKTAVSQAIITTTTTINPATEGQGFTVTGTFATGTASNTAYCDWFEFIVQ